MLGIFRPHDKMAHPLSEPLYGLGAATGPVPSGCWDAPGFKECHDRVFARAQQDCPTTGYPNPAFASYNDCVKDLTETYVGPSKESLTCVTQYCPGGVSPTVTYPWGVYSEATKLLQTTTNEALKAAGYCPIVVDGKLGPATCGARRTLRESGAVPGMTWPSSCQKFTTPGKCPPIRVAPVAVAPVAVIPTEAMLVPERALVSPPKPKIAAATMVAGLGIAGALGALWYVYSQKKAAGG